MNSKYITSQIHPMNYTDGKNHFYIMREDLIPFSFGGNKVRIANQYFKDMEQKRKNCIIAYGNSRSNLSRVIANMSKAKDIPCYVISPNDNSGERVKTINSQLIDYFGVEIITCEKEKITETVEKVINDCVNMGYAPYYIFGDKYGKGNEKVAVQAYVEAYGEIKGYEQETGLSFDYIFLASGTGATQSGLLCGSLLNDDNPKIIGISIARSKEIGKNVIDYNNQQYLKNNAGLNYNRNIINFEDKYIVDGYGTYNGEITQVIKDVLYCDGIPLDTTYTGKGFWGMTEYIKENQMRNKKILFIHTGGTPLFFDKFNLITKEVNR